MRAAARSCSGDGGQAAAGGVRTDGRSAVRGERVGGAVLVEAGAQRAVFAVRR